MADSHDLRGMATTASAVLVGKAAPASGTSATAASTRCAPASSTQITDDHSWVEEQVRAGTMTASAARRHPWRNVVTRALSGGDDPEIDVDRTHAEAGRTLPALFGRLLGRRAARGDRRDLGGAAALDTICDRLIAAANEGGGPDNITVLVLQVDAP